MTVIFSSIGSGVLYILLYCLCVAATAVLTGALLSTVADLSLKGKSDVDQQGVGGFISGIIIGAVISIILTAYLLITTTMHATFMTTLGICACLVVAIFFVIFLNGRLYGRR
jgi:formate/nitrite transporter FocA (FNT family)